MENVQRGDFLDGACVVIGGGRVGMALRASMMMPVWGQTVMAVGAVACLGRMWKIW